MEITRLVNRYIGVSGGYLGDFSYRTLEEFYPEYCDLELSPYDFPGHTTRERFISVIERVPPQDQAKIVRGVIERCPIGQAGAPATRTEEAKARLLEVTDRLDRLPGVLAPELQITSEVVDRALRDAETLIHTSGPTSAVDRVHTALHGYLRLQCAGAHIHYEQTDSAPVLLRKLRQEHPALQDLGPRGEDIVTVLNASRAILDALLPLRNQATPAHPNEELLGDAEAHLVINISRSLHHYLDAKLGAPTGADVAQTLFS